MEEKKIKINNESIQLENGKVVINSDELANLISSQGTDIFTDEEAGLSINFGCKISEAIN